MSLFTVDLPDGSTFIARDRISGDPPVFGSLPDNDEGREALMKWASERFVEAVRAKAPENERLRKNEWYYNGFHWEDPQANRENEVRNFAFATVETVHPILTEVRPRPEVVLRKQYGDSLKADTINERLNWLMDVSGFDHNCALNDREKLKHGYSVYLIDVGEDGIGRNLPYSVYDFYRDPCATTDDEMEYYFLARPLATDYLAELYGDPDRYPHLYERNEDGTLGEWKIKPDNVLSPSYKAIQYPYELAATTGSGGGPQEPENIFGYVARLETGDPNPATTATTSLVKMPDSEKRRFGRTTFLIQMVVKDRTVRMVHYAGDIASQDDEGTFVHTPSARAWRRYEPNCESGWRIITFTLEGEFIESVPLDPCYLGRNVVIDRDYPQVGRWECPGELDHVIPINRSLNRRLTNIKNAHAFEVDPVLVLDKGAGNDLQGRNVTSGDVIVKEPGTQVEFLQPPKATSQQFEMVSLDLSHMDFVSGIHDVTTGRRPEGIEAASAIRNLQDAAQTRIRGKELPAFEAKKVMLKKMAYATGKKLPVGLQFIANDGSVQPVDPKLFTYEFDIRFAPGSGTVIGRSQQEEKTLMLRGQGLLDTQTTLERMGVKGIPQVMKRLMLESQAMAAGQSGASSEGDSQEG